MVIVLLKAIVAIASNMISPPNGQQQGGQGQNGGRANGGPSQGRAQDAPNGLSGMGRADVTSPSDSDVDEARSREIAAKAVTGILITLLKWLKISRKANPSPWGSPPWSRTGLLTKDPRLDRRPQV